MTIAVEWARVQRKICQWGITIIKRSSCYLSVCVSGIYSKVPVIRHVWGMGCAGYINLAIAWGNLQHTSALVLRWD
jgi:hypothetical protein